MNPFITFLRSEWLDYLDSAAELEEVPAKKPKEQNVFVAMDKDIFWKHIAQAFEAGAEMATDSTNAYTAPEFLLATYMKQVYGK